MLDDGNSCYSSNHSNPNHLQADVQPLHHCVAGEEAALVLLQTQLILQLKPVTHTTEVCTTQIPLLLPRPRAFQPRYNQPHTRKALAYKAKALSLWVLVLSTHLFVARMALILLSPERVSEKWV